MAFPRPTSREEAIALIRQEGKEAEFLKGWAPHSSLEEYFAEYARREPDIWAGLCTDLSIEIESEEEMQATTVSPAKNTAIRLREFILNLKGTVLLEASDKYRVQQEHQPYTLGHLLWMLSQIETMKIVGPKAQRWVGYVQGVLVARQLMTLNEAKAITREASGS